ncbi:hypothetical protein Trco_000860 [Trichoderma cornu-damae]|uniref:Uncharacterized protein n=1 Tax=Trichoderma cornu-damae TaxID=654480 RepID=A0A9P8QSS0_9HYPO|nr:hypothetical protein Trco_000860 [Trichoderma cornu-damae]
MRRIMSWPWQQDLRRCPISQRLEFLTGIAYVEPHSWACVHCHKLHAVDVLDHPSVQRYLPCLVKSRRGPLGKYYLEHHHIQLALKLSRMGVNRPYLKKLLASSSTTLRENRSTVYTHTARPKIAGERFLLFEKISIGNDHGTLSRRDMQEGFIMLCPHQALPRSYLPTLQSIVRELCPSTALDDAARLALASPGREVQGHCRWCPTDFSVLFPSSRRELIFNVWHDFGTYGSGLNPYWSSQVWSDQYRRQPPIFNRPLGQSRNLYINAPSCITLWLWEGLRSRFSSLPAWNGLRSRR